MTTLLSFREMGINLTDGLAETGLLPLISSSDIQWRLSFYAAVKASSKQDIIELMDCAPPAVDKALIQSVKMELDKIIPVPVLMERIEQFSQFSCYAPLKTAFQTLQARGITQFAMRGIPDDYPCLLDVWAGSEWRPDQSSEEETWFVLGECFGGTETLPAITEHEYYSRLGDALDLFVTKH
ncbi:hypothetical protein H3J60_004548 [Salmonella enterica]|nr:hypothetical protein [Salmonella enterica]